MDFYKYITSYLTDGTKSFLKLDQNKIFQNNTNKFLLYSRTLNKIDFIDTLKLKNLGSENNRFNYLYANLGSDIHADHIYSNWTSDIFTATDNILTLNGSSKWLLYSDNSTLFNIYKDTKNNLKFNIVNSILNSTNSNIAQLTSNIEKSTNIKTNNLILKEYPIKSTNEIPSKTENAICQWEKIDNGVLDTKILDREFLNNCSFNDDSLISNIKQSYYLEKPIKYQYKKADLKIFFNSSSGTYTMSSQNNNITISGTSYIIDGVSYSPTINKTDYPAGYNNKVTYTGSDNPSEATSSTKYNWKSTYADTSTNLKYYTLTGETETSTNSNTYNITDILIKPVVTIKSSTSKPSGGTVTFDITNNNNVQVVAHYCLTIVGVSTSAIYTTDVPANSTLQNVICTFSGYQGNKVAIITLYFTASDCVTSDGVDASKQLSALTVASSEHTLKKYTYSLTLHYFKDGTEDVSLRETKSIDKDTEVSPSDYKKELSGYTYQDSVPNDSFTMNKNNSIQYNYITTKPTLVAPTVEILSVYKNGAAHSITAKITNPNDVAVECFAKIDSNSFINKGSIVANNGTATYVFDETKSYVTSGTITAYFTADNRLQSDYGSADWINIEPPTLDAPTFTYDDTVEPHPDGSYNKKSVVSVTNSNSVGVSYNAYVDGVKSSGSLKPNETAIIGTWEITDSYGEDAFSVSCSFSTSSFDPSSATDSHTVTPPESYTLTLFYVKDGTEDVSLMDVRSINKGTEVSPSDYKLDLAGYTYQDSVPNDSFTMNKNNYIQYNYITTPTLNAPTFTYDDTVEPNPDGSYHKKSVVSVKNSNSNRVSYSASVDGVKSSGSLEPNATAIIGTWEITDSYGEDTFTVSCSFTASGFEPSSATDYYTFE